MPFTVEPPEKIIAPYTEVNMKYEQIEIFEGQRYSPRQVVKRLANMIIACNILLTDLDVYGMDKFSIKDEWLANARCDYMSQLFSISTNSTPTCTRCDAHEKRRKPRRRPCDHF